ncbi:N-acetyltransferase [Gordonia sihwensis]|uniref:N-acetyltransferase n=1 Tax=Gordonia sihwensis TaxID=173559 RepID=UPI0012E03AD7|nr:N-acetyltransferase [Gordonia sihwensis]
MKVTAATASDIGEAAQVLAVAFADDPIMTVLWPDFHRRRAALPGYFAASMRHHHLAGGGMLLARDDDGRIGAVADWDPPGRYSQSLPDTVRAAPALLRALRARVPAGVALRRTLEAAAPDGAFWYLAHLGSLPEVRGRRFAHALLRQQLVVIDEAGVDAYLVCTRAENISYYQRVGFEVTNRIPLSSSGPTVFGMLRHPAATI